MSYVNSSEVLNLAGITSSEVSSSVVDEVIHVSEAHVDRFTNTTYWVEKTSNTATGGTDNTLIRTGASWSVNAYANMYVLLTAGTGSGQIRKVLSNTADTLTVSVDWLVNPDATSEFKIFYTGSPSFVEEFRDPNNTNTLFVRRYPVFSFVSCEVDGVNVPVADLILYNHIGKLVLRRTSPVTRFFGTDPACIEVVYYYGTPITEHVKSYTKICAALTVLQVQMGGTHNIPSTYSLPEGSVTIGQAYINIRGTWDVLMKQKDSYEQLLVRYASVE